jgi:heme-degrading monooxygenase HmoA
MVLVVFRFRFNPTADAKAFEALGQSLYQQVSAIPGFLSIKDYQSADGEFVNLVEFADMDAVNAWKTDPQHLLAKQRVHEFMTEYRVQVCDVKYTIG